MEDLIACLYPLGKGSSDAVWLPRNRSRFIEAKEELPELQGRGSRESTAPPDDCAEEDTEDLRSAGLQLTFTNGPKTGPGFLLGKDSDSCDIVLPSLPHISRRHCYLTFDAERRLIVRDCSTYGTIIEYDGKGGQKRRHFNWIIGGDTALTKVEEIVIQLDPQLKFLIVVSKPSFLDIYFDNVDHFLRETAANASLPIGALGIQSNISTAAPSGTQTPNRQPILLEQGILGRGTFSVVTRVWDVSTGIQYASKTFNDPLESDWKQEASLMSQMSHEQLVRLEMVIKEPHPQLILEYLPLGSLHQQHRRQSISKDEVISTLQQGLSALTYLHEQKPPIVHRDIKPENILVQTRNPLQIKFADFGLSKASEDLVTFCGTRKYLAPEFARNAETPNVRYTHAVDIWSFGVVIFEYFYGLQPYERGAVLPWCEKIVKKLHDEESDGLVDLLLNMIVIDPQGRKSARECWYSALQLNCSNGTPTPKPMPQQQSQTGSAITTVKLSTRELDALRAGNVMPGSTDKTSRATIKAAGRRDGSKRQRSPDGDLDKNSRSTKSSIPFQDNHETQGSQQVKTRKDQLDSVGSKLRKAGAGSPKAATSQSCERRQADCTRGWSSVSDRTYPETFPSDLLDETNISGCAPPNPQ